MNIDKSLFKRSLTVILSVILLILLDQITKHFAMAYLKNDKPFVIINNILELLYVENTGAAFGTLKKINFILYILPPVISVFIIYLSVRIPSEKKYLPIRICYLLIISGALGNFIDRVKFGYVVDFIYFMPIDFPVFNVADIYVTCSSILLVLLLLFKYKEEDLTNIF